MSDSTGWSYNLSAVSLFVSNNLVDILQGSKDVSQKILFDIVYCDNRFL